MAVPGSGAQISFGAVNQSFTNLAPGSAGSAPSGGQNIKLSSVLGSNPIYTVNISAGTEIKFTLAFGGKNAPFPPYGP
jgi:hypothetical protein